MQYLRCVQRLPQLPGGGKGGETATVWAELRRAGCLLQPRLQRASRVRAATAWRGRTTRANVRFATSTAAVAYCWLDGLIKYCCCRLKRTADIVAVENSVLLELSLADILSFFELYPRLFCNFMRVAELQMDEACLNMSIQVCPCQCASICFWATIHSFFATFVYLQQFFWLIRV